MCHTRMESLTGVAIGTKIVIDHLQGFAINYDRKL